MVLTMWAWWGLPWIFVLPSNSGHPSTPPTKFSICVEVKMHFPSPSWVGLGKVRVSAGIHAAVPLAYLEVGMIPQHQDNGGVVALLLTYSLRARKLNEGK
jgi:hypothetical protein